MEAFFWISLFILFYTYLGYGLLLTTYRIFFNRAKIAFDETFRPPVTVIVSAYNEEAVIEEKIKNCFSLQYPPHLLTLLFITDGSTDNTPQIVSTYSAIMHLHLPERKGKTAALNRAMQQVHTPVVVFTDANAILNADCLQKMVRHYRDATVGGVSGEKRILFSDSTAVGTGERIYWQYESMLKKADASFYTVIGAAGELFSIRTELFEPMDDTIILDDFVLSARICLKGYRFAYEEEAYAMETASANIREEQIRKVRISAGCFQALVLLKALLHPFRNGRLFFQYISRRVLRWTVCPLLVPLFFVINAWLALQSFKDLYIVLFWLQCSFYLLALMGWLISNKDGLPKVFFIPYYFVFMNVSLYRGFYRFISGNQSSVWQKAVRKNTV